jgi:hypothetical protein
VMGAGHCASLCEPIPRSGGNRGMTSPHSMPFLLVLTPSSCASLLALTPHFSTQVVMSGDPSGPRSAVDVSLFLSARRLRNALLGVHFRVGAGASKREVRDDMVMVVVMVMTVSQPQAIFVEGLTHERSHVSHMRPSLTGASGLLPAGDGLRGVYRQLRGLAGTGRIGRGRGTHLSACPGS